jgi:hypothetical protein
MTLLGWMKPAARLPDGLFQTKNPNLAKFWSALD